MNAKPDPADWVASWSRLWQEMYARVNPFISLAPQVLTQPVLPGWLFANSINVTEENSASPGTEQAIVAKYSYGRQLGRIVDVLGELIDKWPGGAPDSSPVRQFAKLRDEIEEIKTKQIVHAISDLAEMKDRNPDEYERLVPKLQEILKAGPARSR
jgi:hypothetical protein